MLGKEVCKVNTTAVSAEKPINVLFTAADVKLLDVFTKEIQYSDTGGDESCKVEIKKNSLVRFIKTSSCVCGSNF